MKNILSLLLAVAVAGSAAAQDVEIFRKANEAYKAGDYETALQGYRKLAGGVSNPSLFLNLGNAAFKTGHSGWAVVYYERGLRLEPRNPDLTANLEFVRERIVDKSTEGTDWFSGLVAGTYRYLSLKELLVLTSVFWFQFLGVAASLYWLDVPLTRSLGVLFSFLEAPRREKLAALLLPAALGLVFFAGWTGTRIHDETIPRAVVVEKEVKATSGPGADATVVFAVHEGTKLTVLRRSDRWAQVSLANGYSGWLPEDAIEEI